MGNGDEERGFTVVDKRGDAEEQTTPPESPAAEASPPPTDLPPAEPGALPEADFTSFLLSLATSALFHMGLVADPESGERAEPNLQLARHTIDTVALLQQKTAGNLTAEEEELMTNLLTELRMRFLDATSA